MFCPKCNAYLTEKDFVKSNTRSTADGVMIEYDARCPNCSVKMGRVVWGHLTIDPELKAQQAAEPKAPPLVPPAETPEEPVPEPVIQPEPAAGQRKSPLDDLLAGIKPVTEQPAPKRCPHCGMELPLGF